MFKIEKNIRTHWIVTFENVLPQETVDTNSVSRFKKELDHFRDDTSLQTNTERNRQGWAVEHPYLVQQT